jgi:hypothetical protein
MRLTPQPRIHKDFFEPVATFGAAVFGSAFLSSWESGYTPVSSIHGGFIRAKRPLG